MLENRGARGQETAVLQELKSVSLMMRTLKLLIQVRGEWNREEL